MSTLSLCFVDEYGEEESACVGFDENATVRTLLAEACEGFGLEGSAQDWRLLQEIDGKRQIVFPSALRSIVPGSHLYVVPAKKRNPSALAPAVPNSAKPSSPAAFVSASSSAPSSALPPDQGRKRLTHRAHKSSQHTANSLPMPTAGSSTSQAIPAGVTVPSRSRSRTTQSATARQSMPGPSSSSSRLHVNAARTDHGLASPVAATLSSFSSDEELEYAPATVAPQASTSHASTSRLPTPSTKDARVHLFTASAASNKTLIALMGNAAPKNKRRKQDDLSFRWRSSTIRVDMLDPATETIGDIQIQVARAMKGKNIDFFVSDPKPEDISILLPTGRALKADTRIDKLVRPVDLIVTCRTENFDSASDTAIKTITIRHGKNAFQVDVICATAYPLTVLAIFERIAEIAQYSHVNPSDHYLMFEQGVDVFNAESMSGYKDQFDAEENNFEIHTMRPYRLRLHEVNGKMIGREIELERDTSLGDLLRRLEREENWEKDSKHLLILEKETDTWKDMDHVDYSEPVFRYAADGDDIAFDDAVYREEQAPKKKRKKARQGSRKSAGQA